MADVHGVLLAAGAGRRFGGPKALARDADGTSWLRRGVELLGQGGCAGVTVVLGAEAAQARRLLDDTAAEVVVAEDWDEGMSASLRAGLESLGPDAVAALVHLVDLPDVGVDVVRRMLAEPVSPTTLRRASYDGRPGHPVVIGRDHWAGVGRSSSGDRGARAYLATHHHEVVECADLASGRDVDRRGHHGGSTPTRGQPDRR